MKFLSLFTSVALSALGAQAAALSCLSDADTQSIINGLTIYLSHPNVTLANITAQALFAPSLVEFGDSINSLRGQPLGTQVEDGSSKYINDELSTPPLAQVNTLNVVHDCNQVAWHFEFIGLGPQRIRGFDFFLVNTQGQIYEEYVEFNSLAWAEDTGFNVTPPATGEYAPQTSGPAKLFRR